MCSPALAGMSRTYISFLISRRSVPRKRGDEPLRPLGYELSVPRTCGDGPCQQTTKVDMTCVPRACGDGPVP